MSVTRYLAGDTSHFSAKYTVDNQAANTINSDAPFFQQVLPSIDKKGSQIAVQNTSGSKLFASVISRGLPQAGDETSLKKGLALRVNYTNIADSKALDLETVPDVIQGTDIAVTVAVHNTSNANVENIALTLPVASGWEIHNANYAIKSDKENNKLIINQFDHQDARDDRVYNYFSLNAKQSKTFRILINASYSGRYYLPAISVSAMYDGNMQAREKGKWINIIKARPSTRPKETEIKSEKKNEQQEGIVKIKKAWLYNSPKENDKTKLYLIENDKFTILKQTTKKDDDWYFIRFIGVKIVDKWIRVSDTKRVVNEEKE
jgi:hypothetical protein